MNQIQVEAMGDKDLGALESDEWLVPESVFIKGAINDMRSKIAHFKVDLIGVRRNLLLVPEAGRLEQLKSMEAEALNGISQTQQIIKNLFSRLREIEKKEGENVTIQGEG